MWIGVGTILKNSGRQRVICTIEPRSPGKKTSGKALSEYSAEHSLDEGPMYGTHASYHPVICTYLPKGAND